ncbi:MAG: 2OG-Fe(II) oxygenase [Ilumatobacter sp.]|nr:2OG-Fe(II) oxygenase [Ilumatobacter sp.]
MTLALKDGYDTGVQLADDPHVWVFDNFLTPDECLHIIELAEPRMDDALVSRLGANTASTRRTGQVAWVKHDEDAIVRGLVARVSDLVAVPADHAENLQVIHYGETQEYQSHFDAWDIETDKGKEKTARGGNRAVTALLYLNEVDGGGGTGFPKLDLEVEAIPGRMVIFHNLYEGYSTRHRKSLHGGLPVTAGEKWACNLWFREQQYQGATAAPAAQARPARPVASTSDASNRAARRRAQRASRKRNR